MGLGPGRGLMSQRLFRSPLSPFPDWPAEHVEECANQILLILKRFLFPFFTIFFCCSSAVLAKLQKAVFLCVLGPVL